MPRYTIRLGAVTACLPMLFLQGCFLTVTSRRIESSAPSIDSQTGWIMEDDRLVGPGLALALSANNTRARRVEAGAVLVLFLPLPYYSENPENPSKPPGRFEIRVTLQPDTDDFRFTPGRVALQIKSGVPRRDRSLKPNNVLRCNAEQLESPIAVTAGSCFAFIFDIPPPPPGESFTLLIDGLEKDGRSIAVPPIRFDEKPTPWDPECEDRTEHRGRPDPKFRVPLMPVTFDQTVSGTSEKSATVELITGAVRGSSDTELEFNEQDQRIFAESFRVELERIKLFRSASSSSSATPSDVRVRLRFVQTCHIPLSQEYTLDVAMEIAGGKDPFVRQYHVVSSEGDSWWQKATTGASEGKAKAGVKLMRWLIRDVEAWVAANK